MKVFVGCTREQLLPFMVLKYSILACSSGEVDVVPLYLHQAMIPKVKRKNARPRTPFSFQRFMIPYLNMYSGKALYLDSDMLVFSDVAQLFDTPMGTAGVLTPPPDRRGAQFAVMVIDCSVVRFHIKGICERLEAGSLGYKQLMSMRGLGVTVSSSLDGRWNDLDKYREDTRLLHYTRMEMQPWLAKGHPHEGIWASTLRMAVELGHIPYETVKQEAELSHVRPEVMGMALKGTFV